MFLEHVHEERRRPRLVPVLAELAVREAAPERDGVEDRLGRVVEAVAVVHLHDAVERALRREAVRLAERREVVREVRPHLLVCVPRERRRPRVHRQVREVVEVREDRHLRELRHARDEREALHRLRRLDDRVERLERRAERLHLRASEVAEERLVVLVHEQHGEARLGRGRRVEDELLERRGDGQRPVERQVQPPGLRLEDEQDLPVELLDRLGGSRRHVEADDGVRLPVVVAPVDRKSPEEVAPALEDRLQGRHGERLPEPARAREEELLAARLPYELKEDPRLVDVEALPPDQVRERVDVCRNRLHGTYYTTRRHGCFFHETPLLD